MSQSVKGKEATQIYEKKGLAMEDYFRPEIIKITEKVYGIYEINKPNSFLTTNNEGEYCVFTFLSNGMYKVETILKHFPPYGGSNIKTDPWNNIVWQNEGRYVRVLEIDKKKSQGFSSVGDVNTKISNIFLADSENNILFIELCFSFSLDEAKILYLLYDLKRNKKMYESPYINGEASPFINGTFLFDSYEDKKWYISDLYLKVKEENELTKALSRMNISIDYDGRPINLNNRIMIGTTYNPEHKLIYFTVRWNENYEDVKIEPIIIQKPENGVYNSGPIISADGNWMKVTFRYKTSPLKVPRLFLYHLSSAYPQGLSMPMLGGYTQAETGGAFVMHDEWGPLYIEQDYNFPDKLFIYKLNNGLKMLLNNAVNGLSK